jgi:hypothetical protein
VHFAPERKNAQTTMAKQLVPFMKAGARGLVKQRRLVKLEWPYAAKCAQRM